MKKVKDYLVYGIIYLAAAVTFLSLIAIIAYIVINGIGGLSLSFFTQGEDEGIFPQIITTLYVIGLTLVIAVVIGIFSAIYLSEYAKQGKLVAVIRFAVDSLAGIPSIVYGLFGMLVFVGVLDLKYSILSGALTLSIMVLPTIIRTTEETLKTVPMSYREGSLALGATKLRTIFKTVLPSAISGIITAVILSIGRIVGESAALYFTAGMMADIPKSIFDSGRTLTVHMFLLAKEGIDFEPVFATGTVLIIIVLLVNLSANFVGKKLKK